MHLPNNEVLPVIVNCRHQNPSLTTRVGDNFELGLAGSERRLRKKPQVCALILSQLPIDSEDSESTNISDDDADDDYAPEAATAPTPPSTSNRRKRKAVATFESDEDSEDEKLIDRWRKAAKAKKPRTSRAPKSALKKPTKAAAAKAAEVRANFDPMTVMGKQQINQKSKLSDLILYTIASKQVLCFRHGAVALWIEHSARHGFKSRSRQSGGCALSLSLSLTIWE